MRTVILAVTLLVVAFSEDLTFFMRSADSGVIETSRHVLSVLANGSEAAMVYRFGLFGGMLQRGSTYVLWHIVWPAIG